MNSSNPALPSHEYEVITPEKAAAYLEKNKVNRRLAQETINRYTRDITSGAWNYSMPIIFDVNGDLIDGQHRCSAIVKSGTELTLLVIRNAPEGTQETLDIHKARNLVEELTIAQGMEPEYAQQLVALARNVWRVKNGMVASGMTLSSSELRAIIEAHPELSASAEIGVRVRKEEILTPLSPSVYSIGHWMITQTNSKEVADWFVDKMMTMEGQNRSTPIGVLNFAVQRIRRDGQRFAHRDGLLLMIKTWNLVAEGKTQFRMFSKPKKGSKYKLPEVKKAQPGILGEAKKEAA